MRKVTVTPTASRELRRAAAWFESERPGYGAKFIEAFDAAVRQIEEGFVPLRPVPPSAGAPDAKRVILNQFRYDVVVMEEAGEFLVVAVAHHSRQPGYWRSRLPA